MSHVRRRVRAGAAAGAIVCIVCAFTLAAPAVAAEKPTGSIPNSFGYSSVPNFQGSAATANPVPAPAPPSHPHMAATASNNIHGDGYASDTHPGGPLGSSLKVKSARTDSFGGECATHTFTSDGKLVAVCGTLKGMWLRVFNPSTLGVMAQYFLGQRPSTQEALWTLNVDKIFSDSSGAYFFLDEADRAVVADPNAVLQVLSFHDDGMGNLSVVQDQAFDLKPHIERDCWRLFYTPSGHCDVITAVMPDVDGHYWWVSRYGVVGTVDPGTGTVKTMQIAGEEIENSFAVDADGAYVVSDHAMYGFEMAPDGTPQQVWREAYDRGTYQKPSGQLNWGSGTTPTLLGADLVAITDNGDPMHVVFMDRRAAPPGPRTLCAVPVFGLHLGATDNSLIGLEMDDGTGAIVVENNIGYRNFLSLFFGRTVPGGMARIDISPDRSSCSIVWTSAERIPSSVSKLSRDTGLVYAYAKDYNARLVDAWYMVAIDFQTGATVWRKLIGTGWNYDNSWASITLDETGAAWAGVLNGLVRVTDGP